MNDPLETLQAELARQNESLSAFEQTLRGLGEEVQLDVPPSFFTELEELCGSSAPTSVGVLFGIRG